MPDGAVVAFPDDMPKEQIKSLIATKFPEVAPKEKPWNERIADTLREQSKPDSTLGAFFGGAGQALTGGTSDELAAAMGIGDMQKNQQRLDTVKQNNPGAYLTGEITGALTGTGVTGGALNRAAPEMMSKLSATMGKSLGSRMLAGEAAGALAGGAYGAGTAAGGPQERIEGAKEGATFGAIGGAAGPAVARVASVPLKAAGSLAERARNLFTKPKVNEFMTPPMPGEVVPVSRVTDVTTNERDAALAKVEDAIRKDYGPNAEAALASLKNGDVALVDLVSDQTPTLKGLAVGSAQYPQGRAIAEQELAAKMAGRGSRVEGSLGRNVADFGGFYGTMDDIVQKGQQKAAPLYEKAYKDAIADKNLLVVPEVQDALQKAYKQYPSALQGVAPDSVQALDYAKKVLDADIEAAKRAGDRGLVRDRTMIKNQLLDAMDASSPSYKEARRVAGDYLGTENAMEEGQKFFSTDPELVKKTFQGMKSDTEKQAYKMGVVKSVRDSLDKMGFSSDPYTAIMQKDGNKKRLGAVLSPAEYKAFETDLKAEQRLFKLYKDAIGGSPTMSKAKAAEGIEGFAAAADIIATGGAKSAAYAGLKGVIKKATDGISDKTAGIIADALYETNPTKKLAIIQKLNGKSLSMTESQQAKRAIAEVEQALRKNRVNIPAAAAGGMVATPESLKITVRPSDKEPK